MIAINKYTVLAIIASFVSVTAVNIWVYRYIKYLLPVDDVIISNTLFYVLIIKLLPEIIYITLLLVFIPIITKCKEIINVYRMYKDFNMILSSGLNSQFEHGVSNKAISSDDNIKQPAEISKGTDTDINNLIKDAIKDAIKDTIKDTIKDVIKDGNKSDGNKSDGNKSDGNKSDIDAMVDETIDHMYKSSGSSDDHITSTSH